jgi:hypothetical protein
LSQSWSYKPTGLFGVTLTRAHVTGTPLVGHNRRAAHE